jgi:acetylornithine aminotransferase
MIGSCSRHSPQEVALQAHPRADVFNGCAGTNILRILPPLCLTKAEVDEFINSLKKVLESEK